MGILYTHLFHRVQELIMCLTFTANPGVLPSWTQMILRNEKCLVKKFCKLIIKVFSILKHLWSRISHFQNLKQSQNIISWHLSLETETYYKIIIKQHFPLNPALKCNAFKEYFKY